MKLDICIIKANERDCFYQEDFSWDYILAVSHRVKRPDDSPMPNSIEFFLLIWICSWDYNLLSRCRLNGGTFSLPSKSHQTGYVHGIIFFERASGPFFY